MSSLFLRNRHHLNIRRNHRDLGCGDASGSEPTRDPCRQDVDPVARSYEPDSASIRNADGSRHHGDARCRCVPSSRAGPTSRRSLTTTCPHWAGEDATFDRRERCHRHSGNDLHRQPRDRDIGGRQDWSHRTGRSLPRRPRLSAVEPGGRRRSPSPRRPLSGRRRACVDAIGASRRRMARHRDGSVGDLRHGLDSTSVPMPKTLRPQGKATEGVIPRNRVRWR